MLLDLFCYFHHIIHTRCFLGYFQNDDSDNLSEERKSLKRDIKKIPTLFINFFSLIHIFFRIRRNILMNQYIKTTNFIKLAMFMTEIRQVLTSF